MNKSLFFRQPPSFRQSQVSDTSRVIFCFTLCGWPANSHYLDSPAVVLGAPTFRCQMFSHEFVKRWRAPFQRSYGPGVIRFGSAGRLEKKKATSESFLPSHSSQLQSDKAIQGETLKTFYSAICNENLITSKALLCTFPFLNFFFLRERKASI